MDVSIIIVSYKTPELLLGCVSSIYESVTKLAFEIIIVDNAPGDGSKDLVLQNFSDVKWIESGYNAGFSRANNIGINLAKGAYILALNPDAFISKDFLDYFVTFYASKNKEFTQKLGFLTCRIVSSIDQSLQVGSGIRFVSFTKELNKNPILILLHRIYKPRLEQYNPNQSHFTNHEIDFVSGACFLIEKSKIEKNNLYFDEDFFLYFEDLELSFRSRKIGLRNYFCAELQISHVNSASTSKSNNRNAQIKISEYLYYFKRFNRLQYYLMGLIMKFNFFFNGLLIKRKNEVSLHEELKFEKHLFNDYFYQIPKKYSKDKEVKVDFLKYD
jgi:GT2 family glycosyltransferase